MTFLRGLFTGMVVTALVAVVGFAAWRSASVKTGTKAAKSSPPPAHVDHPIKEDDLSRIVLTEDAVERLALETAEIEWRPLQRVRAYGGEVTVPSGRSIVVAAPMEGLLAAPAGTAVTAGQAVRAGQSILELFPLLTPEGKANLVSGKTDAEGQVESSQTRREAAYLAWDRSRRVYESEAGSRKSVEEAKAQLDLAEKELEQAITRRDLLSRIVGEAEDGTAAALKIVSPQAGIVRAVLALPGQTVPAGAALFHIEDTSQVWIRVPVYVGDLPGIDLKSAAAISNFAESLAADRWRAGPVEAPPSASAVASTVDLFYALDNSTAGLSPGQRVSAALKLLDEPQSLTVPWSAVVMDIHGGTWVYEQTREREFVRRRVSVRYVTDGVAVLASGPPVKSKVVTAGAAELFGTETGFTK